MNRANQNRCGGRYPGGVTLIEIMLSLVLVTTVLLVSLTASANLLRNDSVARRAVDAETLAGQILDEITSREFQDPEMPAFGLPDAPEFGLDTDESPADRRTFDDVDDYHAYSVKPPTHRDGGAIEGFEGWSFSVEILAANSDATGIVTTDDDTAPLRHVIVTTTSPEGTTDQATALLSNVPSDRDESVSYERWRRLILRFPDRELTLSVPMRNQPDAY